MALQIFNFRTSKELVDLIKLAANLVGARNVSQFVRSLLRERCLEILRDRAPKQPRRAVHVSAQGETDEK